MDMGDKALVTRMEKIGMDVTPKGMALVIAYELGELARSLIYADSHKPERRSLYLEHARGATRDVLEQARLLAVICGWDWRELFKEGEEAVRERIADLEAKRV